MPTLYKKLSPSFSFKKRLFPNAYLTLLLPLMFLVACETPVVPVTGTYSGISETITFGFVEILDDDGNMIGIEEKRDTTISQQDNFSLMQVDKESQFTVTGTGGLDQLNSFSNHKFSYGGQSDFSVVTLLDGREAKRLEFSIDANGNIELMYTENDNPDPNQRPSGMEISFSGQKN